MDFYDIKVLGFPSQISIIARKRFDILKQKRNGIQICLCGSYNIHIIKNMNRDGPSQYKCRDCKKMWRGNK